MHVGFSPTLFKIESRHKDHYHATSNPPACQAHKLGLAIDTPARVVGSTLVREVGFTLVPAVGRPQGQVADSAPDRVVV